MATLPNVLRLEDARATLITSKNAFRVSTEERKYRTSDKTQ
jgi:hypothetical protein